MGLHRAAPMGEAQQIALLGVPPDALLFSGDFQRQMVIPALGNLGEGNDTDGTIFKAQADDGGVLAGYRNRGPARGGIGVHHATFQMPHRPEIAKLGTDGTDALAADALGDVHPVGADFRDGVHLSRKPGVIAPVHGSGKRAEFLQVIAVDQQNAAKIRGLHLVSGFPAGGMEADIEVHGADKLLLPGDPGQVAGLVILHTQGLFTEHMLAAG